MSARPEVHDGELLLYHFLNDDDRKHVCQFIAWKKIDITADKHLVKTMLKDKDGAIMRELIGVADDNSQINALTRYVRKVAHALHEEGVRWNNDGARLWLLQEWSGRPCMPYTPAVSNHQIKIAHDLLSSVYPAIKERLKPVLKLYSARYRTDDTAFRQAIESSEEWKAVEKVKKDGKFTLHTQTQDVVLRNSSDYDGWSFIENVSSL